MESTVNWNRFEGEPGSGKPVLQRWQAIGACCDRDRCAVSDSRDVPLKTLALCAHHFPRQRIQLTLGKSRSIFVTNSRCPVCVWTPRTETHIARCWVRFMMSLSTYAPMHNASRRTRIDMSINTFSSSEDATVMAQRNPIQNPCTPPCRSFCTMICCALPAYPFPERIS